MKTLKLFGALAAAALGVGLPTAQSGERLVLEEVVVTAQAPARRVLEVVVVIGERPEYLRVEESQDADAAFETALAIERPQIDAATWTLIEPAQPTLSF